MYRERNNLMTKYIGLSTDDKPANCSHGSSFFEMDTGKTYHYDETSHNWVETPDPYSSLKSHLEATQITDTASGAIASFVDGADGVPVRDLTVAIEPVQNLHGQEAPYPAGGGKNLLNPNYFAFYPSGYTINSDGTITVKSNDSNAWTAIPVLSLKAGTYTISYTADSGGARIKTSEDEYSTEKYITPSYTFTLSADGGVRIKAGNAASSYPLVVRVQVESGSSATAWSPYENLCPISGHDSGTVWGTKINVLEKFAVHFSTISRVLSDCFFIKAGTYTLSIASMTGATSWRWGVMMKDAEGNNLSDSAYQPRSGFVWNNNGFWLAGANGTATSVTFTFVVDCFIRFVFALGDTSASTVANDAMLNIGSTASPYSPYVGASYHSDFPSTVYGGDWAVTEGEIGETWAIVDLGNLTWTYHTPSGSVIYPYMSAIVPSDCKLQSQTAQAASLITSAFKTVPSVYVGKDGYDNTIAQGGSSLFVASSLFADEASFRSALNGVQMCYELDPPTTLTTDPHTIPSLLGDNNVWSDCGDVSVDYVADPKLYIEQLTEPDADMIADGNITSGSYFMVGNQLFLATANIASGGAITPSVNCTRTNLAEALNALNA